MKTWTTKAVAATALMVVTLLAASGAQATLFTRLNGQAVYDDQANLTWLQDANYASTYYSAFSTFRTTGGNETNYDFNGQMRWSTAMLWAAQLSIEGVIGWRLPAGPMDYSNRQAGSEMGGMFYNVLRGVATNYNFFQNIQSNDYWSGVPTTPSGSYAWGFDFLNGAQTSNRKTTNLFAWAVHDGDVPAPGTLALLGAGLLGWVGVKRARRARA